MEEAPQAVATGVADPVHPPQFSSIGQAVDSATNTINWTQAQQVLQPNVATALNGILQNEFPFVKTAAQALANQLNQSQSDLQVAQTAQQNAVVDIKALNNQVSALQAQSNHLQQVLQQLYDAAGYKGSYATDPTTVATSIAHAVAYQAGASSGSGNPGQAPPPPQTPTTPPVLNMTTILAGVAALAIVGGGIWWWYSSKKKAKASRLREGSAGGGAAAPLPAATENPRPRRYPISSRSPSHIVRRAMMPRSRSRALPAHR